MALAAANIAKKRIVITVEMRWSMVMEEVINLLGL